MSSKVYLAINPFSFMERRIFSSRFCTSVTSWKVATAPFTSPSTVMGTRLVTIRESHRFWISPSWAVPVARISGSLVLGTMSAMGRPLARSQGTPKSCSARRL